MKTSFASTLVVVFLSCSAFAQAPQAPAPDLYALYCWADGYVKYAADVQKTGIRWLRVGGWAAGGPKEEKALLLAAQNGVHFVPALGVPGIGHGKSMDANEAVRKMREVARANVQRYGPGGTFWKEHKDADPNAAIRYWEIWNEPNIEFLTPPDDPNGMLRTQFYAMLLKAASEEIRKLDAGACIIAFNTAGGTSDRGQALKADGMFQKLKYIGWRKFIKDVAAIAGPASFDAIGLHPYTQPLSPEVGGIAAGVEMVREIAKEGKFENKPIWFTEVGYAVTYPNKKNVRDERQQAAYLTRLFALSAAHGVTQVQVMYIEDIVYGPDNTQRSFGFFTAPGKWREQATATKVMKRLIPDPRKNAQRVCERGYVYRFQPQVQPTVVMGWADGNEPVEQEVTIGKGSALAPEGPIMVTTDAAGPVTIVDMLGNCSAATVTAGKVKVTLTEAPVYLIPASREEVEKLLKD